MWLLQDYVVDKTVGFLNDGEWGTYQDVGLRWISNFSNQTFWLRQTNIQTFFKTKTCIANQTWLYITMLFII